jgi:AAA15 family ATPase/GTPase
MKLLNYTFSGIRNITAKQEVKFGPSRKSMAYMSSDMIFEIEEENVKGIFGYNGSGKSSTLYPLYIFRDIVLNKNALETTSTPNYKFIQNVLSKNCEDLNITVEFLINNIIYNIAITISTEEDILYIKNQSILKKQNVQNKRFTTLFTNNNAKTSLFNIYKKDIIHESDFINIYNFFTNIHIIPSKNEKLNFSRSIYIDLPDAVRNMNNEIRTNEITQKLNTNDYQKYKKEIQLFELVLKNTIKPELKTIEIISKKVINNDVTEYIIDDIILDYGFKISMELESDGVKRMFNVFNEVFNGLAHNQIVVIDEIDISLHSDIIKTIINYAIHYSKGQLIFTTHDLLMMDILDETEKAIIIIDNEHNLVIPPKGNGTSTLSKYLNGKINHTRRPINLQKIYEVVK